MYEKQYRTIFLNKMNKVKQENLETDATLKYYVNTKSAKNIT